MSRGDENTFSIPTVYKGIQMRSKLETKVALFLDALKIKWEYEPKLFLLSNGIMYKPDFYLPEHKQWIEVKGLVGENNFKISEKFVEETRKDLILISSTKTWFFEKWDEKGNPVWVQEGWQIGKCSDCNSFFFTAPYGMFTCRKCGSHNGDHDIFSRISDCNWEQEINFSSVDSIKQWLDNNSIRTR